MSDVPSRLASALSDRYRIERELGAGGMATVYLAQDLKHDREVALKVLKPELAAVIGAERFLQEIRTTANLQHPHILPLHDSGQVDGTVFYVMPYIEGESLRDRLIRDKQLPIDEALRVAREVADALGYAHEHGIIHRDIKPENILLQRGHALVADFGIALAASRTGSSRMTETGMSLGTPHYMSPEQAMGDRDLGPRSDVYALGCVCYEMLCGEPPFTGPTPQAIVARVMTEAPRSLRSQRQTVPENVEAAVLQALEKLPADRFGTAAEFAAALGQPSFTRTAVSAPRAAPRGQAVPWKRIAIGLATLAALLVVALIAVLGRLRVAGSPSPPVIHFEVAVPDSIPVEVVTLYPDGTRLLVEATDRSYIYSFADMQWVRFPTPEVKGFNAIALSPDGRSLAFVDNDRRLNVVPLGGGGRRTIADSVRSVSWERDGFLYLIVRAAGRGRITRVRPEGGAVEELFEADSGTGLELGPLLPGGQLLYTTSQGDPRTRATLALDLDGRKSRPLTLAAGSRVVGYAPTGHLVVFGLDGLYAVGFDAERLETAGSPVKLVAGLPLFARYTGGMLAYGLVPPAGPMLFDRRGNSRELPGAIAPGVWGHGARVSPSGHALAFWRYQSAGNRWDVFSYRLPSGPLTRLTSDPEGSNSTVSWSPDGQTIRFISTRQKLGSLYHAAWDGTGVVEPLFRSPGNINAVVSLPDRRVVIEEQGAGLLLATLGSADSAVTLVEPGPAPHDPAVSLDGRWLAYSAVELGRREVFVRPLGGSARRWQISRNGGDFPAWSHSGRELFFQQGDSIWSVPVSSSGGFQVGEPRGLFRPTSFDGFSGFDVLPGDSLFVMTSSRRTERGRVFVVANFLEELRMLQAPPPAGRPR